MSLFRQRQHLDKMVGWAEHARLVLPTTLILDLAGCVQSTNIPGGDITVIGIAAVISAGGWWWCKRAQVALASFVKKVEASPSLRRRYERDAIVGREEDLISGLRSEQTAYLALAASAAGAGKGLLAGYLYGRAQAVASRLRRRGC
jgi:hypothetical protein